MVMDQRRVRRKIIPATATLLAIVARGFAIDWGETTSSTSFYYPYTAEVGEIVTIIIEPKSRAIVEFNSNSSNHFSVSYRQCSSDAAQPLQFQYGSILHFDSFVGGCIHVENEESDLGDGGCTFWQYNPAETWRTSGMVHDNSDPLEPGRARFENQGNSNATVDVVMFSSEVTPPAGIVDSSVWIEDEYIKKDRVINTSVNVYFNKEVNYCETYGCTVTGWVNEYVEGEDSLTLCQVQETGEVWYDNELFDNPIALQFELPEDNNEYYVTLILSAREHRLSSQNLTAMQEYGLDEVVVFQTDTTQEDNDARKLLTSLSLASLAWIAILNMLLASTEADAMWPGRHLFPTLGW